MTKKKILILLLLVSVMSACIRKENDKRTEFFPKAELKAVKVPNPENLWVFILAGQSNMAGRGLVEPQDTVPNEKIYTINKNGGLIIAKEPLHFYETSIKMTGLDCGLSFGKSLIKQIPDSISVLLIPTAVGGSSISQWLGDSIHRDVKLLTNFKEKAKIGMNYGQIKGILWHQGESDAKPENISYYNNRLSKLINEFRKIIRNEKLPVLIGELGSYSNNNDLWLNINEQIKAYVLTDSNATNIYTYDLKERGDKVHFDSEGQRIMGQRFANEFIKILK